MRILATSIIVGALLAVGALPAAAGQSALAPGAGGARLPATPIADATADRESYTQKAQAEMQEWQRKLHATSETAEAKGKEAGGVAESDLNAAWTKAEAASHRLKTASAEGWDSARASYEKASRELAEEWHKFRSK